MNPLIPDAASIPPLPDPPFLERMLFESPWALAAGLLVAAILGLVLASRAGKAKAAFIPSACLMLLSAGVLALGALVTTDRERITENATTLVDAVALADLQTAERLLDEQVRVEAGPFATATTRDQILDRVAAQLGRDRLAAHRVLEVRAAIDGPTVARTHVRVRVQEASSSLVNHSWWRLDWRKQGDDWRVTAIESLWIQGFGN